MANDQSPIVADYDDFLRELKERIRTAQVRAALAVNRELVLLYWQIGQEILSRQQQLFSGGLRSSIGYQRTCKRNFRR